MKPPTGVSGPRKHASWDCTDNRRALGIYVLDAIDPAERALVDDHVERCPECRDELSGLAGLPALLADVGADEKAAPARIAEDGAGSLDAEPRKLLHQITRSCVQGITGLAVLIAGRKRSSLRDEWRSHLAGETGSGLPLTQRFRAAFGFLVAALWCRLQDATEIWWGVAEAVLKSRLWSNAVFLAPTGMAAIIIFRHDGAFGMLMSYEDIAAIGGTLYATIRVGRWYRNVKPPEPKARLKENR